MTLLTIARALALNVGMLPPDLVVASPSREMAEVLQFANETGEELSRRVQWGQLTKVADIIGSGALPADFDRLSSGVCVTSGGQIVRALTRAEWTLPSATGAPRYFLLQENVISLWPEGPAQIVYQSNAWASSGLPMFTADDQIPLIDQALFAKGLIVRWRRQKGMPYQDEEAEFEAALAQYASNNDRRAL